jgi:hypothetical protein
MTRPQSLTLLLIFAFICLSRVAYCEVAIQHDPPQVEHKSFDPRNPPAQMPHLDPGEAAVTETIFDCAVKSYTQGAKHVSNGGKCESIANVDKIELTLKLHVIVWLPTGAPQKLIAHEEGHRRIAEQIYKDRADNAAKAAAAKVDDKEFSASGGNFDQADKALESKLTEAQNHLCDAYLAQTGGVAGRVGDLYDQITNHGIKRQPAEDQAIDQAFERYKKEQKK